MDRRGYYFFSHYKDLVSISFPAALFSSHFLDCLPNFSPPAPTSSNGQYFMVSWPHTTLHDTLALHTSSSVYGILASHPSFHISRYLSISSFTNTILFLVPWLHLPSYSMVFRPPTRHSIIHGTMNLSSLIPLCMAVWVLNPCDTVYDIIFMRP